MSTTYPIKDKSELSAFKNFYLNQKSNYRNYALIIMGLNTALRISDILNLKWQDIFDGRKNCIRDHLEVVEHKTGKTTIIALNKTIQETFSIYHSITFLHHEYDSQQYLFLSRKGYNHPLSRSQAFRIIKEASHSLGLSSHISCHSLRKTFGYHAWQQGIPPALLMDIYNHSSYKITKRYLCIEQDERDEVFLKIML